MFARDADTGMAKWAYQFTPHDEWDYDGVNENVLIDIPGKAGRGRPSSNSTATASPTPSTGRTAKSWSPHRSAI